MKIRNLMLVLVATVLTTGCATFKPTMPSLFKSEARETETGAVAVEQEEIAWGEPQKMLAIWKDSVRTQPGKPSMRGFGGRIYLYDESGAAIRSKGELVIYGFDDSVKDREGSKADQKLVFRQRVAATSLQQISSGRFVQRMDRLGRSWRTGQKRYPDSVLSHFRRQDRESWTGDLHAAFGIK